MGGRKRVLVVGGTGYLGQHLLQGFAEAQDAIDLAFTHHSAPPPQLLLHAIPQSLSFQVDLRTGHGFESISQSFGQPDVVINCAALSVPRACEVDPAAAMSVNVPSALVKWLSSFKGNSSLLIHLSTDQVYEGTKSFYKEENETVPVNVYGKSKVAAEEFISASCSNFAILRSSIIFGPQTISPVPKSLPIQWMDSVLAQGNEMTFFHDEFRCPVYVKDVVTIIRTLTNRWFTDGKQMQLLLNVGGPDRVSRVQMAEAVASARGYSLSLIKPVSASSVDRGVKSPADISMDITKLIQTLDFSPTSFQDGVRLTLADETLCNEWAVGILSDAEKLSEERIDEVVSVCLKVIKEDPLQAKGWHTFPGYALSKTAMNAYTRVLAKKYPAFCINCCDPGPVKTDINYNTGYLSVQEGAATPVKLALLPDGSPSGVFFMHGKITDF